MKIGIVGGGNISDTHARAAQAIAGVEVVAFYGNNRERTAKLAERFGAAVYDDYDRFLAHRPMDMVAIGSPSGVHAEQGIAAVRRGLHVLVEKPIDVTTERADALIEAADRAGVKLGIFFQDRLHPAIVEIKKMVDSGALGKPVLISGRVKWHRPPEYYSSSRWRGTLALDGGGALINQAIHTVDLLLWMFGPVGRVYGRTARRVHRMEAEDTAVAVLEFANGALGSIEATTSVFPGYPRRLEVTGSEGTLILEHDRLVAVDLKMPPPQLTAVQGHDTTQSAVTAVVADATAHQRVLEDFIRAIKTNSTPACDGREGRRSVELVQAIYASARSNAPVTLTPPAVSGIRDPGSGVRSA
jgi:UDP-N-acetyl-2-amino-2-deoxyglucuronate dehydrogenase